jgi:hypothetical protein
MYVFLALISALNLDSSELRFAQIFFELLSIVSGHKHEVLLYVFLLVATRTNWLLLFSTSTPPVWEHLPLSKGASSVDQPNHTALLTSKQQEGQVSLS